MRGIRMEIEIVRNRRLLWELVKRDLRTRYVGSVMGIFWSVINPLIMLIIYIFVFSIIFRANLTADPASAGPRAASAAIPNFTVYLCCGLLPWNALVEALLGSTAIIAGSGGLIKKVVFPAAILPMQAIVASFVNLTITLLLLGVFLAVIGLFPGLWFAMVVPLMALQFILVVGACYLFSTINVFFRDMAPILGACLNFLFWLTPIVYPARLITDRVHKVEYLFLINPVAHLVRLYRQALYRYSSEVPCSVGASIAYLLCLGALAYVIGKYVFTRSQSHLADEV